MAKRGIGISRLPSGDEVSGDHHLLLIGINDYVHWQPLRGPVGDCEGLEQVLFDRYGYDPARTVKLLNGQATRSGILERSRVADFSTEDVCHGQGRLQRTAGADE